ncbi:unnamed protein product [Ectocarpus sp. 4 AP-2014]
MTPAASRVGDTQNQAWKNDKSKFGLKMMQKMGWTEGKGLGKNEDGVSEHVKVAKKSNNLGLGATHDSSGAAGWASAAVSFNGVLETLGKAYGGGADVGGKAKTKGDKRTKKKLKKAEKKKKKKQTAKGDEDAAADSSSSSSSNKGGPAMAAAQAASSCPSRARRVRSKDVKGFSAAELRAILGQAATTADPSLPSYPVVRGGDGAEAAAAAATEPKISKKKSSNKKSRGSKSTPLDAGRPRTRSMDKTAPPAEPAAVAGGKRPRDQPVDHAGEGEETEGEAAASSTTTSAPRKSKKKKAGRAGEGEGEGCETAPVAGSSSKDKKRAKKSKKHKGR